MKHHEGSKPGHFSAAEYPGLREFLTSYLHEDFREEYGSPSGAARAFTGDAGDDELKQVQTEWARLRASVTGKSLHKLQEALHKLGAAWQPQEEEEVQAVDGVFDKTLAKHKKEEFDLDGFEDDEV
ncbi:MAG TPA: contact-dependent growth inhibition system immunity protein [Candidatus Saccharimonadales bacterium]|jgi:hypothetical protein|nr:contact-dependent growth inhibition system immunity protein [Candidatus Saccharimonadales bacterium]